MRRRFGRGRGFGRACIRLQRAQRIGDILKRGNHRARILRVSLHESGFGGLLPMIQSEIIESGLRDVVGQSRGLNKFAKLAGLEPRSAVRLMTGTRLAMATPTKAVAQCRLAEAAWTNDNEFF
jgi:hypothetical protein